MSCAVGDSPVALTWRYRGHQIRIVVTKLALPAYLTEELLERVTADDMSIGL